MAQNRSDVEQENALKVNEALKAIGENDFPSARRLLQEVVANAPGEYVYSYEEGGRLFIKFWAEDEFLQYVTGLDDRQKKKHIIWIPSAYPRAFFYLAYIDMEEGMPESAIAHLQSSLKLEPDQPICYCEMALAYSKLGNHGKALSLFEQALQARPYITSKVKARVLRGKGSELIEFGELDLAKKCLIESLKYEPDSQVALNELLYISILKTGGEAVPMSDDLKKTAPSKRKCLVCGREIGASFNDEFKIMNLEGKLEFLCTTCAEDKHYKEAIPMKYYYAEAYYAQGEAYAQQERLEEALEAFKKAINIKPDFAEAHFRLGWIYNRFEKYVEAIKAYQEAIRIHHDFSEAFLYLGLAFAHLDRREESMENIKKAIQINPNYYEAHFFLGNTHLQHGNYQKAIESFKQAIQINPESIDAHFSLGMTYQILGQYDDATGAFRQSLRINPDHYDSYFQMGSIYNELGRHQEAITCYDRALEINPKALEAWGNKGFALGNLGKYEDAIPCYEKVLEINPEDTKAWSHKGYALSYLSRYQEAMVCYDKVLQIYPRDEGTWIGKGLALRNLGEYQKAMVCYEKVLEMNPKNEIAWCNKGDALENLGRYQEAIKAYNNSIKFASPGFTNQVKEIKRVIQNLEHKIRKK